MGCFSTLDAMACGVTRRGPGFHGFLSLHADEAQVGKSMMHLPFLIIHVTRILCTAQLIRHALLDKLRDAIKPT